MKGKDRNNETYYTKFGDKIIIRNYVNAHNFDVEFEDGHLQPCTNFRHVTDGNIVNKMSKSVFGVGFIGIGKYDTSHPSYKVWQKMLQRCYKNDGQFSITYYNCFVDNEWHCFQSFAEWWDSHKYIIDEDLEIDKDIKVKGNNIYSPSTCLLVPSTINKLFVKQQTKRGNYPIGVSLCKRNNKLEVRCRDYLHDNTKVFLGYFELDEEVQAFQAYKEFKEQMIKDMANHYKDKIPQELYNAMLSYEVEIDD